MTSCTLSAKCPAKLSLRMSGDFVSLEPWRTGPEGTQEMSLLKYGSLNRSICCLEKDL